MSTESLKHARFDREDGTSFDTPMAVVEDGFLDAHEKRSILGEWKAPRGRRKPRRRHRPDVADARPCDREAGRPQDLSSPPHDCVKS